MSEFKSSNFTNEDNSGGPDLVGVTTFTSPYYFVPPSGTTAERPSGDGLAPGMLRFNTDIGRLEVWRGDHWATILGESPNLGDQNAAAGSSASGTGARGVIGARATPGFISTIDYFTISTRGDAILFGDMSSARYTYGSFASSTRGVFTGGNGNTTRIESITFASTGDAVVDSGVLNTGRYHTIGCSNSTRGLTAGGVPSVQSIELTTIASLGNAQNFGDLNRPLRFPSAYASSTRGVFAGGYDPTTTPTSTTINNIQYVTISTTGNTEDFGDLINPMSKGAAVGSSTRVVFGGQGGPVTNNIDFITIATTGNSQDFGDMIGSGLNVGGSFSSVTRGCLAGGLVGNSDVVESVEIASTGNTVDFGDLSTGGHGQRGCSNAHGGL